MDYCFDTSGVNRLYDDASCEALVAGLLAGNYVLVSELNLIEVMTTEDSARRLGLVRLLKRLTRGMMPLLPPTVLLRRLTLARHSGSSMSTITSDESCPEAWWAMKNPEKYEGEESRQFFYGEKKKIEDRYTAVHKVARVELPDLFPGRRPESFGQTLRFFCKNPLTCFQTAATCYKSITGQELTVDEMQLLFIDLREWPLFLAAWAQGLYARAFGKQNYGAKTNAGAVDLWFALYLEHCDFFVTDDHAQYKALRVMNCVTRRKPRAKVMLYDNFRKRLIL